MKITIIYCSSPSLPPAFLWVLHHVPPSSRVPKHLIRSVPTSPIIIVVEGLISWSSLLHLLPTIFYLQSVLTLGPRPTAMHLDPRAHRHGGERAEARAARGLSTLTAHQTQSRHSHAGNGSPGQPAQEWVQLGRARSQGCAHFLGGAEG